MILLLACTSGTVKPADDTADPPGTDTPRDSDTETIGPAPDSGDSADTDTDTDSDTDTDTEYSEYGCSELYDPDVVQEFEVDIDPDEWDALEADYASGAKNYHPIVFHYGDEVVTDAMIRLKGNPYFSWYDDKMQFVISFNEEDPDGRFHGQRKIALDASWYEPTLVRDRVAWEIIRQHGDLANACTNAATLTINGDYYGVYTNIEYFDHEWLERNFPKAETGTLWKYGTEAVSNADASDGSALVAMSRTTDPTKLAALGDLQEWTLAWAAEAVLGDDDGYWCCNHNYYIYEHPDHGIQFIVWDLDDDFDVQGYDSDPITGYDQQMGLFQQSHFLALANDPTWGPVYVDQVEKMNQAMDPDTVIADIDAWEAQIRDLLEADPHRSVGMEEHDQAIQRMKDWIPARHAFLQSWVACQRGETTDADGDGSPVCDDPNDQDATVHPGATETCNGFDDDADGWIDDDPSCEDCIRHDFDDRHFLFCRWPRTNEEAQARCAEDGGELESYSGYGEYYMYFFYTWPVLEEWWTGGQTGTVCQAWDERSFASTVAPCTEEHPSVCVIP
jgi:hypothetical protein